MTAAERIGYQIVILHAYYINLNHSYTGMVFIKLSLKK